MRDTLLTLFAGAILAVILAYWLRELYAKHGFLPLLLGLGLSYLGLACCNWLSSPEEHSRQQGAK